MDAAPRRLPYQPPRWLTPERIAAAAAGIGVAQVTLLAMLHDDWLPRLIVLLVLELHTLVAMHFATRRGTTLGDAIVGVLRALPVTGAVCAAVATLILATASRNTTLLETVSWAFLLAIAGFLAAFLMTPAALPLALVAGTGRTAPSHDAPVRALVFAAAWLLALAAVCLAVTGRAALWVLAPGALTMVAGGGWLALRARFLRRAVAGQVRGFVVVRSGADVVAAGLLPYAPIGRRSVIDTLAAALPPAGGAYRDHEQHVPLCLLARRR